MLEGFQSGVWTAMPGIVQSVDWTSMTCVVQPAIKGTIQDQNGNNTQVNYPLLLDVPIVFPSVAGFAITLPLALNDEVLVVFASRCIDAWFQLGGIQAPMEARMHDLSDGFCIPGVHSKPNILASISTTQAQLRNKAGTTFIGIDAMGNVNITSPAAINLTGNVVVTGTIAASGGLTASAGLTVTGAITATGEITAKQGGAGIDLSGHKHTGVTTGSGTSAGPVP